MTLIVFGIIAEIFFEKFIGLQELLRYYLNIENVLYFDEENNSLIQP